MNENTICVIEQEQNISDGNIKVFVEQKNKSAPFMTFFNLSNSIVGTGVISLAKAIEDSGMALGITLTFISAVIGSFASYLLILCSRKSNENSYPKMVKKILGQKSYILAIICNFLLPFLMCIAYGLVIHENISMVFEYLSDNYVFREKYIIMLIVYIGISLPLSLPKHIAILQHLSLLSMIFVLFYTLVFVYKSTIQPAKILVLPEYWNLANSGIAQGFATLALAYTAHHNVVVLYSSMINNTIRRFTYVINGSFSFSAIIYYLVSISGYISFSGAVSDNIIADYCIDDIFMLVTRIIFCLSVITTLPLQAISARSAILELLKKYIKDNRISRYSVTIIMYLVIYGISLLPVRISTVLQIGGSLTAAPLIMIFPSLLYLKLIQLCYFKKTLITYVLWSLITIGVSLMIIGTSMAIIDAVRGEKEKMVRYWCQSVLE